MESITFISMEERKRLRKCNGRYFDMRDLKDVLKRFCKARH